MSQENLEVVKRAIAAIKRAGSRPLSRLRYAHHPAADSTRGGYGRIRGLRRHPAVLGRHSGRGSDFKLHLEHLEAVGKNRAFAFLRTAATGRASGVHFEPATTNVYTFAEGKIDRVEIFLDREEALEAVGLRE
jgi:ketosteroid isomerase-like protein